LILDETVASEMVALLPRLRRFAYGLTRSNDQADDLAQATLERAIRHVDKWQRGTRMDSWVFAIARNLNLNNLRARRVRGEDRAPADMDDHFAFDGERAAEARLTYVAVDAFLSRLPEEQRSILLLNCVEGLSYKEIAVALGLPVGTVTSRLARARITLRAFASGSDGTIATSDTEVGR
jgi:RNA polymerase sigma-70 factor, ECF subfamily